MMGKDDHPDSWLRHVPGVEMPTLAELDAGGARLLEEIEEWRREDAARASKAADVLRVVTGAEAVELYIEEMRADRPPAIYTGWHDVDEHLGRPITFGELVVISARPNVGKTWALQAWIEKTLNSDPAAAAALLEMEMMPWNIGERLATHALGISPRDTTARARLDLTVEEVMQAQPSIARLSVHPRSLTVAELPAALEASEQRLGIRPTILAIDYMGLLSWAGSPGASTYQRASDNVRALKDTALEQGVVILCACQLSRAAGTGSSRPALSDMRDSGVIEEAADRILGLWREQPIEDEAAKTEPADGELNVCILKNRHGRSTSKDFPLRFDAAMRLVEPGLEEQEAFPF